MGKLMLNLDKDKDKLQLPFYQKEEAKNEDYLKSIEFSRILRTQLTILSTILKIFCGVGALLFLSSHTSSWLFITSIVFYFFFTFPFVMHFECGTRYIQKAWVQKEFRLSDLQSDPITFVTVLETILYLILPTVFQTKYPPLSNYDYCLTIAGIAIVVMDCFALYNYAHIDTYLLIPNRDNMTLYKCYEDNYDPKILTILESTSNYITLKNISATNLKPDFRITREFTDHSRITVDFKEDTLIPPGESFTIATIECTRVFDSGERCFTIKNLRSFGSNVDSKVKTSIRDPTKKYIRLDMPDRSNADKDAYVQLVEIYETEEERKRREAKENIRPIASTSRTVERNYRI